MPIFDDLEAEQEQLHAVLAGLTEEQWLAPSAAAGWSVADVMLHLAQTEEGVIASAAGTFPAAIPAFLSLGVIVLDGTMRGEFSVFLARCWAIGSSLQIAAGPSAAAMTWSVEDVVSYLRHCASDIPAI